MKKFAIATLLTAFLIVVGASSVSAKYGWGDSLNDAMEIYSPGGGDSSASFPIEGTDDYDFFLINNNYGSEDLRGAVSLHSPSGLNYDMQFITVDSNGQIISVTNGYDTGAGSTDANGIYVPTGQSLYVKVYSHGAYDYSPDQFYRLAFTKFN